MKSFKGKCFPFSFLANQQSYFCHLSFFFYLALFFCLLFAGDYDGALSVFTEMQLMCQERGLQLPGTSTPVGQSPLYKMSYV